MYWNGYIEKIGSGTEDMVKRCINHGLKSPEFFQDNDFKVIFWRPTSVIENTIAEQSVEMVPDRVKRLLRIMDGELSISEILKLLQLKHRGNLMKEYLSPALGKYTSHSCFGLSRRSSRSQSEFLRASPLACEP